MVRGARRKTFIVHKIDRVGYCRQSLDLLCRHEGFKAKLTLQYLGGYADRNSLEGRTDVNSSLCTPGQEVSRNADNIRRPNHQHISQMKIDL